MLRDERQDVSASYAALVTGDRGVTARYEQPLVLPQLGHA